MKKHVGFTQNERDNVVLHCKMIGEQIKVLLNEVNGRIYARHLDKLCRISSEISFFADEFEHGYPIVDDPVVRCPKCKNAIPAGELDYYRAYCHDCIETISRSIAETA